MPQLKNPQWEQFANEYLRLKNATKAAIAAGYSPRSAYTTGSRLRLENVEISSRIAELQAEQSLRTQIDADKVLLELAKPALANAADIIDFETGGVRADASREDTAAIQSVRVKTTRSPDGGVTVEREVRLLDKNASIAHAMRHFGMFDDKNRENQTPVEIVLSWADAPEAPDSDSDSGSGTDKSGEGGDGSDSDS